jgi:hypothetical protein
MEANIRSQVKSIGVKHGNKPSRRQDKHSSVRLCHEGEPEYHPPSGSEPLVLFGSIRLMPMVIVFVIGFVMSQPC